MTSNRLWLALILAGCCCAEPAFAQTAGDTSGGTSGSSGGSTGSSGGTSGGTSGTGTAPGAGAGSGPGAGSTSGAGTPSATGAASSFGTSSTPAASGSGASSSFSGSTPSSGSSSPFAPSSTGTTGTTGTPGSATLQGGTAAPTKVQTSAPPTFSLPGFYGTGGTTFVAGQGRLSRPRFRYTVSVSQGYDDNIQQTPTNGTTIPATFADVVVDPGTPDTLREVPVFETRTVIGQGGLISTVRQQTGVRREIVPGTPAKIERVLVSPEVKPDDRTGSLITRGSATIDIQLYSSRALFTFDLSANADHYWNRPGPKQTDYNGSLGMNFVYKITPRTSFTAAVSAAYLTQPDISRINTPQAPTGSDYLSINSKFDLSYRWNPRFTSVVSFSDNALLYQEKAQQSGDYNSTVFGTEMRYLWSPRLTVLGELRYSQTKYDQAPDHDTTTTYLLLGFEAKLSARLSGTLRLGESMQEFVDSGEKSSTPYLEGTVAYILSPTASLNLNGRFGFEEPNSPGQQRLVYRMGLNFTKAFTPRLNGVASGTYLHERSSAEGVEDSISDTFDGSVRLEYQVTRRFSLNTSLSYTTLHASEKFRDYFRTRFFIGGDYTF